MSESNSDRPDKFWILDNIITRERREDVLSDSRDAWGN